LQSRLFSTLIARGKVKFDGNALIRKGNGVNWL